MAIELTPEMKAHIDEAVNKAIEKGLAAATDKVNAVVNDPANQAKARGYLKRIWLWLKSKVGLG